MSEKGLCSILGWVDGRHRSAHNYAVELRDGPTPTGCIAVHKCPSRSRLCITHVRWGTHSENALDREADARAAQPQKEDQ